MTETDKRKLTEFIEEFGEDEGVDNFMRYKCRTDLYYLASEILGWKDAKRGKGRNNQLLDPKFHRWLIDAFDERIRGDYATGKPITSEDVQELMAQAREFLRVARNVLGGKPAAPNPGHQGDPGASRKVEN